MNDRATLSYDDKRMTLTHCACGRLVSNGEVCAREGCCVVQRRADQIAAIAERQRVRREQ